MASGYKYILYIPSWISLNHFNNFNNNNMLCVDFCIMICALYMHKVEWDSTVSVYRIHLCIVSWGWIAFRSMTSSSTIQFDYSHMVYTQPVYYPQDLFYLSFGLLFIWSNNQLV